MIWHDLKKNPDDLPDSDREVLVYDTGDYFVYIYKPEERIWEDDYGYTSDYPEAWTDIPKFKEDE